MRYYKNYEDDAAALASMIYLAVDDETRGDRRNRLTLSAAAGAICAGIGLLHDDLRRIAQALEDHN